MAEARLAVRATNARLWLAGGWLLDRAARGDLRAAGRAARSRWRRI